jgi:hypothetical protein
MQKQSKLRTYGNGLLLRCLVQVLNIQKISIYESR